MTNRREFLQIGMVAASAWPLSISAAGVAPRIAAATLPLYKAIYDVRFPQSAAFAERAIELGVAVHAIDGDMTRFWYEDLYHRWKQGPAAIAGLTAHGPLFCLEQLALDQRMRVVFRAEHKPVADSCVDHEFAGPAGMLDDARSIVAHRDWASRMADLVVSCPSGRAEITVGEGRTERSETVDASESLYSWVIAPAVRV
jgi:hypothetical protein